MLPELEHIPTPDSSFACREAISPRGFLFKWHFHPELELTYIDHGTGTRFVGDHIERFVAGDLVLLGKNLPHSWRSDAPTAGKPHRSVFAQFRGDDLLGRGWLDIPELRRLPSLFDRAGRGLSIRGVTRRHVIGRMERMLATRGLERLLILVETLDLLSRRPAHLSPLSSPRYAAPLGAQQARRIDLVCRYLNDRFREPVTLAEAADVASLSESAFGRFFLKMTGRTFKGYLNELRVGTACDLLVRTETKIATIAGQSGFDNLSNFNRQFLKHRGIGPAQYRRQFGA
jgi:AraC-like DNA-binding protein